MTVDSKSAYFIQVAVKKIGGYNLLTKEKFLAIPLDKRLQMITDSEIQFLLDGKPLPLREGLQKLKDSAG